jgi:pimeloyl-ACP methyl ester carboxylesterase
MPMIQADDGVRLYAESTGSGTPMLFIHEFAGDHRSWEPQVQYFSAALERECEATAAAFESEGAARVARRYATARSTASWRRSTAARGGSVIPAPFPPPPPA